ncbi:MAG: C1 family peptidase [Actinomycetes bacterium]
MIARRRNQFGVIALLGLSLALLSSPALAWGSPALAAGVPAGATYSAGSLAAPLDASLVKRPLALTGGLAAVLPPAVDLSAWVPPVGDQGGSGTCYAWATTYYAKTMMEKKEHPSWDLSDPRYQFSPAWTDHQVNDCGIRGGGFPADAMRLLTQRGAVDMAEMPFDEGDAATRPLRRQLQAAKPYRNLDYGAFWIREGAAPYTTPVPIEDLKAWLAAGNPVVINFQMHEFSPFAYGAPVHYLDAEEGYIEGNHAVCIVGYDDDANPTGADADHRGGFKVVNSLGPDWNGPDKGFIYLSYHYMAQWVAQAWWMEDAGPDGPVLDSISVDQANAGGVVTLKGSNFGALRGAARVSFNGVDAPSAGWSNERVTALVPEAATSGPLTLYDWEGNATASFPFVVGGLEAGSAFISSTSPATCSTGTTVTVSARGGDFGADSQLYLAGDSGLWIPASEQVASGTTSISGVFDLHGVLPGKYTIAVRTAGGKLARTNHPMVVTDGVDTFEPNDSPQTAHGPVQSGTIHVSYISAKGDQDFYEVRVPRRRATIAATLSGIPDFCVYSLSLCDASGKVLASSDNYQQMNETVTQVCAQAGTYYVLVSQSWNCDRFQPYSLEVTID